MVFTSKCRDTIATAHDNFIVIAMDNNQRGQRKKQQREGTSNNFIVVTHSMAIKPLYTTPNHVNTLPMTPVKSPITYLDQAIVSVDAMSGFENITSVEDVISYITMDNKFNTPLTRDYSGRRVDGYSDIIRISYGLLQQRQFLSRTDTEFKFVDKSLTSNVQTLIEQLNTNRTHLGLYAKSRMIQNKEVT